jgi:hypothetical protein
MVVFDRDGVVSSEPRSPGTTYVTGSRDLSDLGVKMFVRELFWLEHRRIIHDTGRPCSKAMADTAMYAARRCGDPRRKRAKLEIQQVVYGTCLLWTHV